MRRGSCEQRSTRGRPCKKIFLTKRSKDRVIVSVHTSPHAFYILGIMRMQTIHDSNLSADPLWATTADFTSSVCAALLVSPMPTADAEPQHFWSKRTVFACSVACVLIAYGWITRSACVSLLTVDWVFFRLMLGTRRVFRTHVRVLLLLHSFVRTCCEPPSIDSQGRSHYRTRCDTRARCMALSEQQKCSPCSLWHCSFHDVKFHGCTRHLTTVVLLRSVRKYTLTTKRRNTKQ